MDIICVDYLPLKDINSKTSKELIKKIQSKGFIPYISTKELDIYGESSKNAIKREIFTLITEAGLDRTTLEAHQYGATVLEYFGYKQVLYDINRYKKLPPLRYMKRYAGVLIWLRNYTDMPDKL